MWLQNFSCWPRLQEYNADFKCSDFSSVIATCSTELNHRFLNSVKEWKKIAPYSSMTRSPAEQRGMQRQGGAVRVLAHWLHGQKKMKIKIIYKVLSYKTGTGSGSMRQGASPVSAYGNLPWFSDWLGDISRRKTDADRRTDGIFFF